MRAFKSLWELSGWLVLGYTTYKHLQTLNEAKNEFYVSLEPSQQARWDAMFGKPTGLVAPSNPHPTLPLNVPPTLTQMVAGT